MTLNIKQRELIRNAILSVIYDKDLIIKSSEGKPCDFTSLINKLNNKEIKLNQNELSCLTELTKNKIVDFSKKHPMKNAISWLNVPDEVLIKMEEKDALLDLISISKPLSYDKFGFNVDFRSRNVLANIEKMKKSNKILMSMQKSNHEICFVYQDKEYFLFDLGYEILIDTISFKEIYKDERYTIIRKSFETFSKNEVYNTLIHSTSKEIDKYNLAFLKEILK